jgi:AraC family transcriptional regulator
MACELRAPGFASDALVELMAAQLAIELRRYCGDASISDCKAGLSPWRLRKIEERLQEENPPTLKELASLCRISVRQLTRAFRASRGCSIGDVIAQRQMKQAQRLLLSGGEIKQIATRCGFSNPSSFTHAFRRETGLTPSQFRHRMR